MVTIPVGVDDDGKSSSHVDYILSNPMLLQESPSVSESSSRRGRNIFSSNMPLLSRISSSGRRTLGPSLSLGILRLTIICLLGLLRGSRRVSINDFIQKVPYTGIQTDVLVSNLIITLVL